VELEGFILLIDTMSSPKKARKKPRDMTADELMKEINKLNSLLQDKLKIERDTEEEEYQALLRRIIGRRVRITVKGPYQGKEGVITRHAGDTFHPVNWYVKLPDGSETRKHKGSFKLLPRQDESSSSESA